MPRRKPRPVEPPNLGDIPAELLIPYWEPPWFDAELDHDPRALLYADPAGGPSKTFPHALDLFRSRRRWKRAVAAWADELGLTTKWGQPLPEVWEALRAAGASFTYPGSASERNAP